MTPTKSMGTQSRSDARVIAIRMTAQLNGYLAGRLDAAGLVRALRKLADDIEAKGLSKPKGSTTEPNNPVVDQVFEYWRKRVAKPTAKLTSDRRRVIAARVRDGYTLEQIKRAIDGCASSDFHNGENPNGKRYQDLTLILRNGSKLEQFAEMASDRGAGEDNLELAELRREAAEALARGDHDAYNHANARIRALSSDPAK